MNREELVIEVNSALSEEFEISAEKLTADALLFDNLGLDSLDAVDMIVHLEDRMGIKLDIEKMQNVRTLGNVYDLIEYLSEDFDIQELEDKNFLVNEK